MNRPMACLIALVLLAAPARAQAPSEIDAIDAPTRPDLVGQEVIVEGRVRVMLPAADHKGIDLIALVKTPLNVRLPSQFRLSSSMNRRGIRAQGILRKEGRDYFLDATAPVQLFAGDIERLDKVAATFAPGDYQARMGWGEWAARRAALYDDDTLMKAGRALQSEALAIQLARPESRSADAIHAIALKAREQGVAEPEPSALIHVAYRMRLNAAKAPADLDRLAAAIQADLPRAKVPNRPVPVPDEGEYLKDPAGAYRRLDAESRAAFDRDLWADAAAESIRLRAESSPGGLMDLAQEAESRLPDRPAIAAGLRRRYLDASAENVGQLREAEMVKLARTHRDELKDPAKADAITRSWLEFQRKKLSPTGAEDRVLLAQKYLALLKDRDAAAALLREALKVDPASKEADNAFLKMGFAKVGGEWRDPRAPATPSADDSASPGSDPFLGLTPSEVKAQLGEPKHATRIATQGRVAIQWIYDGAKGSQYIDFLQRAGDAQPIVVGRYAAR